MRAIDYTGMTFGACHVIGPAGEPRKWLTRCTRCGRETVRTTASLRCIRHVGGFEACKRCRVRTYDHLQPINEKPESEHGGWLWQDGKYLGNTPMGQMQQDFYLGKLKGLSDAR